MLAFEAGCFGGGRCECLSDVGCAGRCRLRINDGHLDGHCSYVKRKNCHLDRVKSLQKPASLAHIDFTSLCTREETRVLATSCLRAHWLDGNRHCPTDDICRIRTASD